MTLALRFLPSLVILATFLVDRFTKEWVQNRMILGQTIPILPFFNITFVKNTGIAFGMGQNRNEIFVVISILILLVLLGLLRYWERTKAELRLKIYLALVIGGAVGNLFDRIAYGNVIDFLDVYAGSYHWPSFNIADSAVCVGAILLALSKGTVPYLSNK